MGVCYGRRAFPWRNSIDYFGDTRSIHWTYLQRGEGASKIFYTASIWIGEIMQGDSCMICRDDEKSVEPYWSGLKQCRNCGHCVADLDINHLNLTEIYSE